MTWVRPWGKVSTETSRYGRDDPEEVSSSESDKDNIRGMLTHDEEELWRRVERE